MGKCFVIQPFDRGRFDKRYEDVFAPAIEAIGLEPYRVDRDPGASIPVETIESAIKASEACLAEISTDNPNVWFELGFAIASQREVVLVCSDERKTLFPFDVQHRNIIKYFTESTSDFKQLTAAITERLRTILTRRDRLGEVAQMQSVTRVEGLDQHEIAARVAVAEEVSEPMGGVSAYSVRENMEKAGFTKLAATLGLRSLRVKGMLETFEEQDGFHSSTAYRVTDTGLEWLNANKDKLIFKVDDVPF